MREGCAYCEQTKRFITQRGKTYEVIDMTHNAELGNRVAKAAHSMNVPVVTIADTPEEFTFENMYVGWNIKKLLKFIEETK
jgi:glutaredoxin